MTQGRFQVVPCNVVGVLAVEAESVHTFPRHSHEQFGFGLIDRGVQRSLSGRGIVEAGSGDLMTVNPSEIHDGAPLGAAGCAWRMLYLGPAPILETACDANEGKTRTCEFVRPVLRNEALASAFRALSSTAH